MEQKYNYQFTGEAKYDLEKVFRYISVDLDNKVAAEKD